MHEGTRYSAEEKEEREKNPLWRREVAAPPSSKEERDRKTYSETLAHFSHGREKLGFAAFRRKMTISLSSRFVSMLSPRSFLSRGTVP